MPRRPYALLLLIALMAPAIAACRVEDQPDGWGSPTLDPADSDVVLLPTGEERVVALELGGVELQRIHWTFPDEDENTFPGLIGEIDSTAFYADPLWSDFTHEWLLAEYRSGVLYAVQPDGSSARIVFDVDDRIVADLVPDPQRPGIVYLATTGYRVHAVQLERPGDPLWSWDGNSDLEIWGTPAIVDTTIGRLLVVGGFDGRVTALHLDGDQAGQEAWTRQFDGAVASGMTADQGTVYFGSLDRIFHTLDGATGDELWRTEGTHWFWSTPLIHNGIVYAVDLRGALFAWDAGSGALRWQQPYQTDDPVRARPQIGANEDTGAEILVVVTRAGAVHQLDPESGARLMQFPDLVPDDVLADFILLNDRILVGNERGELYAVLLSAFAAERLYAP